ncbi:MAG: hypothetical protein R3212_06485 [Xanthomonadales bacterium]|nr:hypothetical protein [Xanthomonadales bacterium]
MGKCVRFSIIMAASCFLLILAGSDTAKAHGGDPDLVHACVNPAGHMRLVAPNEGCRDEERAVDWGIQGPPGPPGQDGQDGTDGQDGLDGQDGQDGSDGLDGVSGYLRVIQTADWQGEPPYSRQMIIDCPDGRVVLGAGSEVPFCCEIINSYPLSDSSWLLEFYNPSSSQVAHVVGYATCAFAN